MNCIEVHNLLSEYLDGEIQGTEREDVQKHLAQCESCAQAFAVLQSTSRLLSEAQELEPPVGLLEQIEVATINRPTLGQKVRNALEQLTRVPASARWTMASAAAAAVVLFAVMSNPGLHLAKHMSVPSSAPQVTASKRISPSQTTSAPKHIPVVVAEVKASPKPATHRRMIRVAKASSFYRTPVKPSVRKPAKAAPIPRTDIDAAKKAEPIPTALPEEHVVAATPPAEKTSQEIKIVRASNASQTDWQKKEADSLAELRAKLAARNKQRRYEVQTEPLEGRKVSIDLASIRF